MQRFREYAEVFLDYGVTSVRNMAGIPLHLQLRAEVEEGRTRGPRVFTTGPILETRFTWPGLSATRSLILVTITIQALSLFTQISVMTQGGPLNSTTTVVYGAVESGFAQQETGYASAISLFFFALVLTVSLAQRYLTRDKD